jgi:hypothetical protein
MSNRIQVRPLFASKNDLLTEPAFGPPTKVDTWPSSQSLPCAVSLDGSLPAT